jgi:hypothetical protein
LFYQDTLCVVIVCLIIWNTNELKGDNAKLTHKTEKIELRILYAGHPGSHRKKDFTLFLAKHFDRVETGNLASFKVEQANGFDVIILDYDGDGFKAPHPELSPEYTRSTMTVGVAGALICNKMSLKTGYL